ncbi:hypothetical protein AOQ84DRAFT_375844 [Glonium stellatum]|uniref:Uncharacterized protein n=1 Tax=Glonium stellatum TaxID=574774 RepID=A0A8E2F360_9PEZI|nr:hypothetical protein AOQ84DRAFT_375844 [Glonium stellatum]
MPARVYWAFSTAWDGSSARHAYACGTYAGRTVFGILAGGPAVENAWSCCGGRKNVLSISQGLQVLLGVEVALQARGVKAEEGVDVGGVGDAGDE